MNIFSIFRNSVNAFPDDVSLVVEDTSYSYKEFDEVIGRISFLLNEAASGQVAILAYRSLSAYAGILATLKSGKTYVPLNPKFPASRNRQMVELSNSEVLIVDNKCLDTLLSLNPDLNKRLNLIFPETKLSEIPSVILEKHEVYTTEDLKNYSDTVKPVEPSDFAYILFTSGSTGIPKGVPVSHGNVTAYVEYLNKRYGIQPTDRFSQTFDLTFDLSVHDMFLCWRGGGSLYPIPEKVLMAPAKFIKEHNLTMWFSVPSLAQFMHKFRMLKPEIFPSLRYSLFCGEPLPKTIAISWQKAAHNSVVENIYGPTEATIGITHYRLPADEDKIKELNGVVSIGSIFGSQEYCLVDAQNNLTEKEGELCLSGSQVTAGYWKNPEKTWEQFIQIGETGKTWYKTGDIVRIEDNNLLYIGRIDFQVKIRGYRVELDEINNAITKFTDASVVCSIPYPVKDGVADSIYSFVDSEHAVENPKLLKHLATVLPEYMVPKDILYIDEFPLNSNGKIDRKELVKLMENKNGK